MNIKIGELVEYVEDLKRSHERKVKDLRDTINDLVRIKEELEKECDGLSQVAENLGQQVKVAEEGVESCKAMFKEMENKVVDMIEKAVDDTEKKIGEKLKKDYAFSAEGVKEVLK